MRARRRCPLENHYELKPPFHHPRRSTDPKRNCSPPSYDTAKTYRGGELKTAAYAIQPTVDQSVLLKRNAP